MAKILDDKAYFLEMGFLDIFVKNKKIFNLKYKNHIFNQSIHHESSVIKIDLLNPRFSLIPIHANSNNTMQLEPGSNPCITSHTYGMLKIESIKP